MNSIKEDVDLWVSYYLADADEPRLNCELTDADNAGARCPREAVFRALFETPCGHREMLCLECKDWAASEVLGIYYNTCKECKHSMGKLIGFEKI